MNHDWLIGVALILGILSFLYLRQRRRATAIRELAMRSGFIYIGDTLPRSVSLRGTELAFATSVWNVIDGEPRGIRIVAFDCQIGSGKGSWRRTVIAAQSETNVFGAMASDSNLTIEHSENWTILYQPKTVSLVPPGLMHLDELEAHLNAIGS
jgi:hypothetical protein